MRFALLMVFLLTSSVCFAAPEPEALSGVRQPPGMFSDPWYGAYVCNQGITRLKLSLKKTAGLQPAGIEAEFAFSPDPANPSVPAGAYLMKGSFDPVSGAVQLRKDKWTEQPEDASYRMVDLEGVLAVAEGGLAVISGRILAHHCGEFTVWQLFSVAGGGR